MPGYLGKIAVEMVCEIVKNSILAFSVQGHKMKYWIFFPCFHHGISGLPNIIANNRLRFFSICNFCARFPDYIFNLLFNKQVIQPYFAMYIPAIHVSLDSVCRYESLMQGLTGLCGRAETFCSLTQMFVILFCDFELSLREFHLTEIDGLVTSVNQQINLPTVSFHEHTSLCTPLMPSLCLI